MNNDLLMDDETTFYLLRIITGDISKFKKILSKNGAIPKKDALPILQDADEMLHILIKLCGGDDKNERQSKTIDG